MNESRNDDPQLIQKQIHEKKTSILESTRRMLGLIDESEAVGNAAATQLVEQHEKLKGIEQKCDSIDQNLVSAQQNLNKLGSLFGGIKNYFNPPKTSFPKSISQPQISQTAQKNSKNAQLKTGAANPTRATNINDEHDTYFGKPRSAMDDVEREAEDGLHHIHQGVGRLKLLAEQMNRELEDQKPLTDRLTQKIEVLNENVQKKNQNMKTILLR